VATAIPDHFSLFGLEPSFAVDAGQLARAYRTVQSRVHPDRYAAAGAAEQRAALQWATLANEAYQVLSSPLRRAAYLCERNGVTVQGDSARSMAPEFMVLQMQWRESLEQLRERPDSGELEQLRAEAGEQLQREMQAIEQKLDRERDFQGAADAVRRLMFIEKFLSELGAVREADPATRAG